VPKRSAAKTETAKSKGKGYAYCGLPPRPSRTLPGVTDSMRLAAILVNETKWVSGTTLRFHFFGDDAPSGWSAGKRQCDVVRQAFETWERIPLGLSFQEVGDRSEAEIRIGRAATPFALREARHSRSICRFGRSDLSISSTIDSERASQ